MRWEMHCACGRNRKLRGRRLVTAMAEGRKLHWGLIAEIKAGFQSTGVIEAVCPTCRARNEHFWMAQSRRARS